MVMICNYSLLELSTIPFYVSFDLFFMFTEKKDLKREIGSEGLQTKPQETHHFVW